MLQQLNYIDALPLCEDLHKQMPGNILYQEQLALALIGDATTKPPAEKAAMTKRAKDVHPM